MSLPPLVSVVMPVYNGELFLDEAVESILAQSLQDFEFIVIDDGSTDRTPSILERYRQSDRRVQILTHSENLGIVAALNVGMDNAHGKYLARMDADDISLPLRLEKQVDYLEANPEIGLLGCGLRVIDKDKNAIGSLHYPQDDLSIRWTSLFESPFAHPAIIVRSDLIRNKGLHYDPYYERVEDYPLWLEILKYTRGANLPEELLLYRLHSQGITIQHNQREYKLIAEIIRRHLREHLPSLVFDDADIEAIIAWRSGQTRSDKRARAGDFYFRTWLAFKQAFGDNILPDQIQKQVIIVFVKLTVYPPLQSGWLRNLGYLSRVYPAWPVLLLVEMKQIINYARLSRKRTGIKADKK
jgi:glycosyltransferase involved in cell wall biosynthesis